MSVYFPYDYAWDTPGWTVQNPAYTQPTDGYVAPGLPDDVSLVRVFASFLEWSSGRNLDGVVEFRVEDLLTHVTSGQQVMPGLLRMRFQKAGFSVFLPATDDPQLTPPFQYHCRMTVRGETQEFTFSLPASPAEVNILDLIPDPVS